MPDTTPKQQENRGKILTEKGLERKSYSDITSTLQELSRQFLNSLEHGGNPIGNIPFLVITDVQKVQEVEYYLEDTNGDFLNCCDDFIEQLEKAKIELDHLRKSREKVREIMKKLERVRPREESQKRPITYVDPNHIYKKIAPQVRDDFTLRKICGSVAIRVDIIDLSYNYLSGNNTAERLWDLIEKCSYKKKLDVLIEVCIDQEIIEKGSIDIVEGSR